MYNHISPILKRNVLKIPNRNLKSHNTWWVSQRVYNTLCVRLRVYDTLCVHLRVLTMYVIYNNVYNTRCVRLRAYNTWCIRLRVYNTRYVRLCVYIILIAFIYHYSPLSSRLIALACDSTWVNSFFCRVFEYPLKWCT